MGACACVFPTRECWGVCVFVLFAEVSGRVLPPYVQAYSIEYAHTPERCTHARIRQTRWRVKTNKSAWRKRDVLSRVCLCSLLLYLFSGLAGMSLDIEFPIILTRWTHRAQLCCPTYHPQTQRKRRTCAQTRGTHSRAYQKAIHVFLEPSRGDSILYDVRHVC